MKYLYIILISLVSYHIYAQDIYAWQKIDFDGTPRYHMYKYDFFQGNQELLFSITQQRFIDLNKAFFTLDDIQSFEFSTDRRYVFFIQLEGALFRYEVSTDSLIFLLDLTPETTPFLIQGYTQITNIDFISDSILYTSGFTFSEYNINTNTYNRIRQPISNPISSTQREQDILVGRLVNHKGKYIYFSQNTDKLMLLDMANPDNNSTILDLGQLLSPSFDSRNLVSIQFGCDSTNLYFLGTPKQIDNTIPVGWYKLDAETGALQFSHLEPLNISERFYICHKRYNSPTWESCQRYIDLDVDNSTVQGIDFRYDSICSYAAAPLSDLDIKLHNEYPIDSLVIDVLSPTSPSVDINIPSGNYTITSSNTAWRIINNGTTSVADYMNAIRNASLNNLAQVNEMTLQFTVWYDSIGGNPAITTLVFPSSLPNSGTDITHTYCEGDTTMTLLNLPSVSADLGGTFYDANFNIITNLETSVAPYDAVFYYEASNGVCYDTAQINLSVRPIPTLVGLEDVVICSESEYTAVISVDNNASLIWSDGNPDRTRMFSKAGTYSYQITNQYGCIASDTFTLTKLPPATSMTTDVQICDGETFTYMEKVYDVPGNYTDTIMNVYGCDSVIFNLNLGVYPFVPIVIDGDLSFCEGNSTSIFIESPHNQLMLDDVNVSSPLTITESGDFLIAGVDQNGCITEKEISITMHPNPKVLTLDMIDTVFVLGLALPVSYDGDIETYRWSPSTALDCGDCPYPTLLSAGEGIYTIAIKDKNGCKNEAQLSITFLDTKLYFPNVISNHASDPENQVFYIKGNNSELYSLSVYDRWGNLIFHRKDAELNNRDDGWSPRGKVVSGVYIYLISYMENKESKTLYGSITVLD